MHLRPATEADLAACLAIYAPYVENTTISFEYAVPSLREFTARYTEFTGFFPWLVAEEAGRILGYAYAHRLAARQGYAWAAESTVYVDENARRSGAGRALYTALIELLRAQGMRKLYALVTHPNPASDAFHQRMGFALEGLLEDCGYKFGRPTGVSYYGLALAPPGQNPAAPAPFHQLGADAVQAILAQSTASSPK